MAEAKTSENEAPKITVSDEKPSASQPIGKRAKKLKRNRRLLGNKSIRKPGEDLSEKQLVELCQSTFRYSCHQFKTSIENGEANLVSSSESSSSEAEENAEDFETF